jgi:hypothetical protein
MVLPTPAEALLSLLPEEERNAHRNKTIAFAKTIEKLCIQVSVQPATAQRSNAPSPARISELTLAFFCLARPVCTRTAAGD